MLDKLYVELDIDLIKYIYASSKRGKVKIKKFGSKLMPPRTFINGKVENKDEFIRLLSEIKKELGVWSCSAYLSLSGKSIITRTIELPITGERDMEKHLSLEAEQYLPINPDNYQVSFRIMKKGLEEDSIRTSVMIAAAPNDGINSLLECFDSCRLRSKVLDVYPNNIYRLLNNQEEDNIAVIDMDRRGINITITENRSFYLHSVLQVDMELILDSYRKGCKMGVEEFNSKHYYGEFDFEAVNSDNSQADKDLEAVLYGMLKQTSMNLDYYNSRHFGKAVDRIYVIGEYGMLKGLKGIMERSYRTSVTIGMKSIRIEENNDSRPFEAAQMSYYSLLGMVLRG